MWVSSGGILANGWVPLNVGGAIIASTLTLILISYCLMEEYFDLTTFLIVKLAVWYTYFRALVGVTTSAILNWNSTNAYIDTF